MTDQEETYTRTGVRRAGDDYQDVVALDILVSMLEHPGRYEWIRVEADDFGNLDDVVALRRDGTIEAKQVKYSAHPENSADPYDWDDLTATKKGKNGQELLSLVGKWGPTLFDLLAKHNTVDASLVTNRRAAPALARCIDEASSRVLPGRVPRVVMDELARQLGSNESAVRFLCAFQFKMDRPGLATWETSIYDRFKALGGEYVGWLNLKDDLKAWVREKNLPAPDGHIRLADVQRAARWHRLEALPQGVSVPADYVLPSATVHQSVFGRLSAKTGNCLVISGTPGIGKSTYLSYLHRELREQKRPVVRHHYFLSLSDTTVGRFEHARVIESLMAELRSVAPDALGQLDASNPLAAHFPKWLDACSVYYAEQKFPLVIMVDGLDHVWRERQDTAELNRLFENLLPCRAGICLVVGTQPLADASLPKRLLNAAPRENWIALPPLDRQAVLKWTRKNESCLEFRQNTLPDGREEDMREIATALFDVSGGQPLLLRYGISALIESGQSVNAISIRQRCSLVGGNTTDYYRALWNGLGNDGRFVLCMIVSAGFEWPAGGLSSCCARKGISGLDAERSWQQVVHLMCRVPLGWRPFHSSLGVFVEGTAEYAAIVQQVRLSIAAWLTEDAPDYWRWAYSWSARSDVGEHEALLSNTTRAWVVESLARGYPHVQACAILRRAARQALLSGDFRGFAHKTLLLEYANAEFHLTSWNSQDEWIRAQLTCDFVDRLPDVLFSRRNELDDQQLAALADSLRVRGNGTGVATIVDELIDRVNTRSRMAGSHDWIAEVTPIVQAEASMDVVDASHVVGRIKRNRKHFDSVRFSHVHAEAFRVRRRAEVLRQLCDADLTKEEKEHFLKQGFLLALEEDADWSDVARRHSGNVFSAIYARITGVPDFICSDIALPATEFLGTKSLFNRETGVSAWLVDCFDRLLALFLWEKDLVVQGWLSEIGKYTWRRLLLQHLAVAAKDLANAIEDDRHYSVAEFYNAFNGIDRPQLHDRDGSYEFWQLARHTLCVLSLNSLVLAARGATPTIELDTIERTFGSPHFDWSDWIREYIHRRQRWMSGSTLDWITHKYGDDSNNSIADLSSDGVSQKAVLASLMAMHGRREHAFEFLRRSVDLTITYGNHKDILLHDYVETVELLAGRFPEHGRQEIWPVIPAILHVHEFTDGKETRHVPGMLFDLLATLSPEWLPPIYRYLCQEEEYYEATDAFRGVLKSMPFTSPVEMALGSTCLDKDGLDIISAKVGQGCAGARQVLDSVHQLLGGNPFAVKNKESDNGQAPIPSHAEGSVPPKMQDYPPNKAREYWNAVREHSYGRGAKELKEWADHWEQQTSPGSVRDALVALYEVEEYTEVANIIYELTVRLQGRDAAWPWLVKSHREIHGWSAHWASKEDALPKWEIVRRYYPDRWLDFVVDTMAPGRWSSDGIGIHGRFPRLIEYLLLADRECEAKSLLQGVREMVEELVSPFGLRPFDWLNDGNSREDQLLSLLLARLTWPSGMVRERACNALAKLLVDGEASEQVTVALTEWIKAQTLESVACYGLLPFIRAQQLNVDVPIPDVEQLRGSCSCPSILYQTLLNELCPTGRQTLTPGIGHAEKAPCDFQPCSKFSEHYDRALPTMYRENADSFDRKFSIPFQRQWAYEVEHTGDGLNSAHFDIHFWGRRDGEHYVAFDCPLSEGLRSGYLRALAWLAEQGKVQQFIAMAEALRTLPIDVGLWKVAPGTRPDWWPILESPAKTDVDTVPSTVFRILEEQLSHHRNDDWTLGMASGRVAEGGAVYDLDVFGVFQKCLGSKMPEAEEVWQSEPWYEQTVLLDQISPQFNGKPRDSKEEPTVIQYKDWEIIPCVQVASPCVVPRWQWWRFLRGIWLPLPVLAPNDSYQVNCEQDRIAFQDEQGEVGYWQDWTAGVSEMQDSDLTPRTGQIVMLRRSVVQQFAAANGMTFCWVCRIRGFQREYGVGKHDEFCVYRVIGASRLIL